MRRRSSAPDNEAPVAVPTSTVLGRGPNAAVLLTSALAYSTGTEFALSIRVRPRTRARNLHLHQLIAGFGPDEFDANRRFLLGVQYADGRRTVAADMPGAHTSESSADDDQALSLALGSGSGSDNTYDLRFWLSPLPPPGPVTMVCRWPEFDIDETKVTLDGTAIAAAGRAAVELWPPETPEEQAPAPPTTLPPDSGWFARQD